MAMAHRVAHRYREMGSKENRVRGSGKMRAVREVQPQIHHDTDSCATGQAKRKFVRLQTRWLSLSFPSDTSTCPFLLPLCEGASLELASRS